MGNVCVHFVSVPLTVSHCWTLHGALSVWRSHNKAVLSLPCRAVNDSRGSDDVRNALAAIDAYKSIVDAISAADKAAKEAKAAADKASEVRNSSSTESYNRGPPQWATACTTI